MVHGTMDWQFKLFGSNNLFPDVPFFNHYVRPFTKVIFFSLLGKSYQEEKGGLHLNQFTVRAATA